MYHNSDSSSLTVSVMEEKEDENKSDKKNVDSITRPARNRKQRKFDDFVVFGKHGPQTSSTPIIRSNSQKNHNDVELPGANSDFFSPSTESNLTFDQSSILDESSTSEISCDQTSSQSWTMHSLSHLKYLGKRDISNLDTAVDSPTPVKKKKGRPRKIEYAANDQSSVVLPKTVFHTPVGEIREKVLEKSFEEKNQDVDTPYSRVNEIDSSFQEENNSHNLDMENRQETSSNPGPMSDNSQVISLVKDKSATSKEKLPDGGIEVRSLGDPMKKGRGRPRKYPKQKSNNHMFRLSLHESQVKDDVSNSSKEEIHGCGKDSITAELPVFKETVESQRDISQGDPAEEQDSPTHPNSFSDSSGKRRRGRPPKTSQTQSKEMQMKDCTFDNVDTSQGEVKSQRDVRLGDPAQEQDSLIHPNTFPGSSGKRARGRPKKCSQTQSKDMQMMDCSFDNVDTSQNKDKSQRVMSPGNPAQGQDSLIHPNSFSDSSVKRARGRPKKCSQTQSKDMQMKDYSFDILDTYQGDVTSQRDMSPGDPAQGQDSLMHPNIFSDSSVKRRRGRPKKNTPTQSKDIEDYSMDTSQIEARSQRGISKENHAQDQDSLTHSKSFSDATPRRTIRQPKRYSPTQFNDIQMQNCSLDSLDACEVEDSIQCPSGALKNGEDNVSRKNKDGNVQEPSICSEREGSYEDAQQSSCVEEQERDVDSHVILSNTTSSSSVKRGIVSRRKVMVIKRGRGRPRKHEVIPKSLSRVDGACYENGSNAIRNENQLNESDLQTGDNSRKRKLAKRKSSYFETSLSSSSENDDWEVTSSRGRGRGRSSRGRGLSGRGRGLSGRGGGLSGRGRGLSGRGRGLSSRGRGRGRGLSGRGRGRSSRGRGRQGRGKSSCTLAPSDDIKCSHCEQSFKLKDYKIHLMSHHSLIYTPEQPQGVNDSYQICKRQGYVACQKCSRHFKNPQYYRHHIIWCGREDEMFVCSICNRKTKVMWETQHMRMHKQQEESRLLAEKRKEEEFERRELRKMEELEEKKAGKRKRKAARSAMSLLNNLEPMSDEGTTVSNDENMTSSDDEDSDEDEAENTDKEDKERSTNKNPSRALTAKQRMWMGACRRFGSIPLSEKMSRLHKFYDGAGDGRLFPELSPMSEDWQALSPSERDKYLPRLKQSPVISSVHGQSENADTFTLTIGECKCIQEKGFCYTGGPIWAMEWCPRPLACSQEQMLAIALDNQPGHHLYVNKVTECSNLLQFWSVRRINESKEISPRLDFCIAHDSGYVRSLSWCPAGCFDKIDPKEEGTSSSQEKVPSTSPRLGLLAAACSNATILIFSIPHPSSLDSLIQSTSEQHKPVIVKPKPCFKLIPNSMSYATPCLSVSWQNGDRCERIIGGYGRGEVLMWSLASSSAVVPEDIKTLRPIRAFVRHKIGVVTCAWCPSLPHLFVSCDYNGLIYLWNSNRPQEPESVLKKTNGVITKAVSMAGPVHWGLFTANDKICIPDTLLRSCDMYGVNFHGISPQCCVSPDFNVALILHSACTWDVTFDPVFNTLVICDALGNVYLALPNEDSLLTSTVKKTFIFALQTPQGLLYKLSVTPEDKGAKEETLSLATSDRKKAETVHQSDGADSELTRTNCCKENSGESSVPVNEREAWSKRNTGENTGSGNQSVTTEMDPKSLSQKEKAPDAMMLCYHETAMGQCPLKKPLKRNKITPAHIVRENYGQSNETNLEAIQRVSLCPGMDDNLWLASGGNGGVLRFDRLHDLVTNVTPYCKRMTQEISKLRQESTKAPDS